MDACEVAASVTALAIALAQQLNDEQLNLLAAVLTQLGDTLNTILIQRDIVAGRQTPTV